MAGGRRPQLRTAWPLHALGFPHHIVVGFHHSERFKGERGRNCHVFYDLASEVTLHHFHGFITTDYAIGEPIRCDYARPSWRLAAPVVLINSISQALLKMLIEGPWLV